jgi:CheY-like chemotaxis protein
MRIGLGAAVVLLSGAALRGWDLARRHQDLVGAGRARTANLSLLLAGYLQGRFAAADASLRQLALHSQRVGGPAAPDAEWLPSLHAAGAGLTAVGAVSVVDTGGIIRHSTQPRIVGQSRRTDYLIRGLASESTDVLVASEPFRMVVGRGFIIPLGRRLTDADGRLTGVVAASFVLDSVRRFFREADVGHDGMVWVFHPSGVVLIREPSDSNPIGETARETGRPIVPASPPPEAERGNGEVILLVEDATAVRQLAKRLLEDLGYQVEAVEDGPSAIALARGLERIDLVLTDVMLPGGMSGREVGETLVRERPGLPVVYTSGYSEDILSHRAQVAPDQRLVAKPFDQQALATALRAALRSAG